MRIQRFPNIHQFVLDGAFSACPGCTESVDIGESVDVHLPGFEQIPAYQGIKVHRGCLPTARRMGLRET